jgi:uncharacterized membrane protein YagU involved in acid resistance
MRALLYGTLAVGILDGLDAIVFFGLRSGTTPARIFKGIAVGLLGRDALSGGAPVIALGVLIHFFIAFSIVLVYLLASRRFPALGHAPLVWGPIYGVAVYFVMNKIVIPSSAIAGTGALPPWPVLINGLLIHMFGVGLPASLAARAARAPRDLV